MKDDVRTVLVVEDDRATRMLLTRLIERLGYVVHEAGDGLAALECLKKQRYDLLLTDLNLPGMDGKALANHVRHSDRALPELSRTMIVALTAQGELLPGESFDDVLVKPISMQALSLAIARWMHARAIVLACNRASATRHSPDSPASLPELDPDTREILPIYVASLRRDLVSVLCVDAQSFVRLGPVEVFGHRLKGSGGMYGFGYLSELGNEIELAVQDDKHELALALLHKVDAFLSRVSQRLGT